MTNKSRKRSSLKKIFLICFAIAAMAAASFLILRHIDKNRTAATKAIQTDIKGTPSKPTQHQIGSTINSSPGGSTSTSGQKSNSLPPSSQWITSRSGNITLQQPSDNVTLQSGDSIIGLAKVNDVQFILVDDSVGLIDQGTLNVVNGGFSGILQFTPKSQTGTLQLYYPNPNNGAEEDAISINVKFNP